MRTECLAALLPCRRRTYVVLAAVGVAAILMFDVLYVLNFTYLSQLTTNQSVEAFDLDAEGSLGTWFNTVLLFLCGQVTLLLWRSLRTAGNSPTTPCQTGMPPQTPLLLSAIVWFVMSADEGGSLHEGFKEMLVLVCGTRLYGDGSLYWIVPYFVVLAAAGTFLLSQMGRTAAGALLITAGILWGVAVLNQLELFLSNPRISILLEETCEMLGTLCLLGSLCLFARQTIERLGRRISVKPDARTGKL
ncbi:MAG: hypothetical protein GXY25_20710 [Pirellulaceae bacterium]|jgi:hypothetical protein|nr:hypothetical protein [Pirellulaceae bacterium]